MSEYLPLNFDCADLSPLVKQAEKALAAVREYEAAAALVGYRREVGLGILLIDAATQLGGIERELTSLGYDPNDTRSRCRTATPAGGVAKMQAVRLLCDVLLDIRGGSGRGWGTAEGEPWTTLLDNKAPSLPSLAPYVPRLEHAVGFLGRSCRSQPPAPGATAAEPCAGEVQAPAPGTPAAELPAGEVQVPAPGKTAAGPVATAGTALNTLNRTDHAILKVVKRKALKGESIALKIDREYDYVRRRLARLVKIGRLRKTDNGYRCNV